MTRPFVCATDFSDAAARSANAAAALAARFGEPLVLVHVFESPGAVEESLVEPLRAAARKRLGTEAERLRLRGVTVEEELLEGSPYEAIVWLAERASARLVVMASHRKRSLPERWFFGGVAERIVKTATVPCLVLRDPSFVEEWLSGQRPLRLFVGADLSDFMDAPLLWVKELAAIGPCEITVAYLNWVPDEAARLGLGDRPASLLESSHQVQSILENELRNKVTRLLGELPVTFRVEPRWPPSFDRVLVATDFSDTANHAIPYACALTAPGGTLCLGHVAEPLGLDEAEAQRQLTALIPPHAAERGIRCETAVWHGRSAAEDIVHLAEHFEADAICIGSNGRSGVARALLGSVAQAVLSNSKRPVLVVRKV